MVNFWFPYQALRDLLPPGHATRPLVLRTWLCYVFTVPAVLASELTALAWLDVGVAIGIVAILGWILVGAYGIGSSRRYRWTMARLPIGSDGPPGRRAAVAFV